MCNNQLIVQLRAADITGYDTSIQIEEKLMQAFEQSQYAEVDGHDMGQGKFNIFIIPKVAWETVFEQVKITLELCGVLQKTLIAKRLKTEQYEVVWPNDYMGNFEL